MSDILAAKLSRGGETMISRIWHGWTRPKDAGAYEKMLRAEVLPGIGRVKGYLGAYLLRRDAGEEVEFITITQFEDLDAVRAFAGGGPELTRAVIHGPARALFTRYDEHAVHYETVMTPEQVRAAAAQNMGTKM